MVIYHDDKHVLLVGLDWDSGALTMSWLHGSAALPAVPVTSNTYEFFRTAYRYREVWVKNLQNCGVYHVTSILV